MGAEPVGTADERPGGVQQPAHGVPVVVAFRLAGEVSLHVLYRAREDVQLVAQSVELAASNDERRFVEAVAGGTLASLEVALAAASTAELPGSSDRWLVERPTAPSTGRPVSWFPAPCFDP